MEPDKLESLVRLLAQIDQNKLTIIAIVVIVVLLSNLAKWYFNWRNRQQTEKSLKRLGDSIDKMVICQIEHKIRSNEQTERMVTILCEIRDQTKGAIGKQDSIAIIEQKFDYVKMEIAQIFEWSITHNHYEERSSFIKRKIKTVVAECLNLTRKSLEQFDLSVDAKQFFSCYVAQETGNIHLILVDNLWDAVEPIYKKNKIDVDEQLEEMRIIVSNVMSSHVEKIKLKLTKLYD
ncbi:hypothetical protein KAR91_20250 [Candidatus Pacearchaeota archaeon]|nr:hypothetical protein [Candidatus Pacearchaeota archaeon]